MARAPLVFTGSFQKEEADEMCFPMNDKRQVELRNDCRRDSIGALRPQTGALPDSFPHFHDQVAPRRQSTRARIRSLNAGKLRARLLVLVHVAHDLEVEA